jgi:hypothetical protein
MSLAIHRAPDSTMSRKERLRTLETDIRMNYEAFVRTGFALKEIRDDELYREDGFATWEAYLKTRVGEEFGIERGQAFRLIQCAQIQTKASRTPEVSRTRDTGHEPEKAALSQRILLELGRLAPKDEKADGQPRDFSRLDRRDVQRVLKKANAHCRQAGVKLTATVVRKFVDADLGIDRAAQARETRQFAKEAEQEHRQRVEQAELAAQQRREGEEHPTVDSGLFEVARQLDTITMHLEELDANLGPEWRETYRGVIANVRAAAERFTHCLKAPRHTPAARPQSAEPHRLPERPGDEERGRHGSRGWRRKANQAIDAILADGQPHGTVQLGRAVFEAVRLEVLVRLYWSNQQKSLKRHNRDRKSPCEPGLAAVRAARWYVHARMHVIKRSVRSYEIVRTGTRGDYFYQLVLPATAGTGPVAGA